MTGQKKSILSGEAQQNVLNMGEMQQEKIGKLKELRDSFLVFQKKAEQIDSPEVEGKVADFQTRINGARGLSVDEMEEFRKEIDQEVSSIEGILKEQGAAEEISKGTSSVEEMNRDIIVNRRKVELNFRDLKAHVDVAEGLLKKEEFDEQVKKFSDLKSRFDNVENLAPDEIIALSSDMKEEISRLETLIKEEKVKAEKNKGKVVPEGAVRSFENPYFLENSLKDLEIRVTEMEQLVERLNTVKQFRAGKKNFEKQANVYLDNVSKIKEAYKSFQQRVADANELPKTDENIQKVKDLENTIDEQTKKLDELNRKSKIHCEREEKYILLTGEVQDKLDGFEKRVKEFGDFYFSDETIYADVLRANNSIKTFRKEFETVTQEDDMFKVNQDLLELLKRVDKEISGFGEVDKSVRKRAVTGEGRELDYPDSNEAAKEKLKKLVTENPEIERDVKRKNIDSKTKRDLYEEANAKEKLFMFLREKILRSRDAYAKKLHEKELGLGRIRGFFGKELSAASFEAEVKDSKDKYDAAVNEYRQAIVEFEGVKDKKAIDLILRHFMLSEKLSFESQKDELAIKEKLNEKQYSRLKKALVLFAGIAVFGSFVADRSQMLHYSPESASQVSVEQVVKGSPSVENAIVKAQALNEEEGVVSQPLPLNMDGDSSPIVEEISQQVSQEEVRPQVSQEKDESSDESFDLSVFASPEKNEQKKDLDLKVKDEQKKDLDSKIVEKPKAKIEIFNERGAMEFVAAFGLTPEEYSNINDISVKEFLEKNSEKKGKKGGQVALANFFNGLVAQKKIDVSKSVERFLESANLDELAKNISEMKMRDDAFEKYQNMFLAYEGVEIGKTISIDLNWLENQTPGKTPEDNVNAFYEAVVKFNPKCVVKENEAMGRWLRRVTLEFHKNGQLAKIKEISFLHRRK
ncbi:MAG: hypothetical protein OEV93_02650 [Candidatus Moranbacteria bacterium]|nr:hypothetical protein [Candidatus Moranbacteria bacterium]